MPGEPEGSNRLNMDSGGHEVEDRLKIDSGCRPEDADTRRGSGRTASRRAESSEIFSWRVSPLCSERRTVGRTDIDIH